ncbi:MAG: SDR family oxidoreductase [Longimicrobiales bacterium]|nr:SDR family oxidoreductase [Longimicrobiales bacterium]
MMTSSSPPEPSPAALVTGGGVRLGRAITLALAEAGYDLVINYRSSEGPARETAEEVEALGRRAWTIQGDLAEPATAGALAEAVRAGPGRLDLLVNSAASFDATPLLEADAEGWDAVLAVNTRGPHLLTRACADLLRETSGAVVNIADHMGIVPRVRYGAHSVSKGALIHLTRTQALALAPEVRVNAIAPGLVLPPDEMDDEKLDAELSRVPLARAGSPRDVTDAVLFLARAEFVTGHLLVVDGGQTLRG